MTLPNTRELFESIEARRWPQIRLEGRDVGGSERQWLTDFPALTIGQLRQLDKMMTATTSRLDELCRVLEFERRVALPRDVDPELADRLLDLALKQTAQGGPLPL